MNKVNKVHILTTEAQLSKITKNSKLPTDNRHFHSYNHQKWLPYKFYVAKP